VDELKAFIVEIWPLVVANFPFICIAAVLIIAAIGFSIDNTK